MSDSDKEKIVNFYKYCPLCKYSALLETQEPCSNCLSSPSNLNSQKPVFYKDAQKKTRLITED